MFSFPLIYFQGSKASIKLQNHLKIYVNVLVSTIYEYMYNSLKNCFFFTVMNYLLL